MATGHMKNVKKDSKGGNTTENAINHHKCVASVMDNYRHLWPSMAARLRQGCEDRHGDHSEETTPEDDGLTLEEIIEDTAGAGEET